jgi:hypothetical protein
VPRFGRLVVNEQWCAFSFAILANVQPHCHETEMSDKPFKLPLPLKIVACLFIGWASFIVLSVTSIGVGALLLKLAETVGHI